MTYNSISYTPANFLGEAINFKFKSWADFKYNLDLRIKNKIYFSEYRSSREQLESGFNDTGSLYEARERLEKKTKINNPEVKKQMFNNISKNYKMYLADTPFETIDIPSYLSFVPDYWVNFKAGNKKAKRRIVKKIFLTINALGAVNKASLKEYLENSLLDISNNYIFEKIIISAVSSEAGENDEEAHFYIDIPAKDFNLIFRAGFSDFFRRIVFFFREQSSKLNAAYGVTLTKSKFKKVNKLTNDDVVFAFYNR